MKFTTHKIFFLLIFLIGSALSAQDLPRIQFVNNSPDPGLSEIDTIYIENTPFVTQLSYQEASGLKEFFSGQWQVTIRKNGYSEKFSFFLEENKRYAAIISGVIDTTLYSKNPSGISRAVSIDLVELRTNTSTADIAFTVYNGISDAPPVDISTRTFPFSLGNIRFRSALYTLSIPIGFTYYFAAVGSGSADTLGIFEKNLEDPDLWQKTAPIIILSGFQCPDRNKFGPEVSMYAVFPSGSVEPFLEEKIFPCGLVSYVEENFVGQEVATTPNPAQEKISFLLPDNFSDPLLLIFDEIGNKILERKFSSAEKITLELENFSSGIFFYSISDGEKFLRGKFIKQD